MKYQRFTTLGCKDIGNSKFEVVAKTQFLFIKIYKVLLVRVSFVKRSPGQDLLSSEITKDGVLILFIQRKNVMQGKLIAVAYTLRTY